MRIAFVVHDYSRKFGQSRYVVEIAERFSRDHEVHVLANTFHVDTSSSIRFHHVPAWRMTALTTVLSFLFPATRRVNGDFDIVHAQGLSSMRSNVITAHICNRAWYEAQKQTETGADWRQTLFDSLVSPLEKRLYRNSNDSWVIAVSEEVRNNLARFYDRENRLTVIHHGVDVDLFKPDNRELYRARVRKESGLDDADFTFLFVGDLRKGGAVAIEALGQTKHAKLLFVSASAPERLQRLAAELSLTDRVIFHSATDYIERFYAAADAFIFPTSYDAFGMVILEAMAAGLPVITTRRAGAAELLEPERDALLLEDPYDANELAHQLQRIISSPSLRESLAAAGRKKMEAHSWDLVAQRTMSVYEQVLANN